MRVVDQLKVRGPGYVSAVAMEEVTLLDYNRTRPKRSLPLVAIYPAEGTFDFDNPRYQRQLIAGHSKTLPSLGLEVWMPDAKTLGRVVSDQR